MTANLGYIPLLITGPTQKIIECIIDEDVTEEAPYKLINKLGCLTLIF